MKVEIVEVATLAGFWVCRLTNVYLDLPATSFVHCSLWGTVCFPLSQLAP